LLQSLPALLSAEGELLLMASSLSDEEVLTSVPTGFQVAPALDEQGRRVPLDVDVVWQRPDWRRRLLREGRIEEDSEGSLWHTLRPIWIRRSGDEK
jgi:hypothetical protein